jgi:hypothetical protein
VVSSSDQTLPFFKGGNCIRRRSPKNPPAYLFNFQIGLGLRFFKCHLLTLQISVGRGTWNLILYTSFFGFTTKEGSLSASAPGAWPKSKPRVADARSAVSKGALFVG